MFFDISLTILFFQSWFIHVLGYKQSFFGACFLSHYKAITSKQTVRCFVLYHITCFAPGHGRHHHDHVYTQLWKIGIFYISWNFTAFLWKIHGKLICRQTNFGVATQYNFCRLLCECFISSSKDQVVSNKNKGSFITQSPFNFWLGW